MSAGTTRAGDEFDVVVVGRGSAGCALAGRLTEDPTLRVLLLEAGGSDNVLEVQIPAGLYKTWRTRLDWNYTTEPQPGLDGRKLFWPRGKLLGGSSSINAMIYMRGAAADYDEWAESPATRWSYDARAAAVPPHGGQRPRRRPLPRRRRAAAGRGPALAAPVDPRRRPVGGGRRLSRATTTSTAPRQEGVGQYQVTQKRGRRWSSADAYLHPAEAAAQPDRADRRADHPGAGRGRPGDRRRVPRRRAGAHRARRPRGRAVRRRDQLPAAADAVGHRPGRPPARGRRRRRPRPARRRRRRCRTTRSCRWSRTCARASRCCPRRDAARPGEVEGAGRGPLTSNLAEAGLFTRSSPELAEPDLQNHFLPVKFWKQAEIDPDVEASARWSCWCTCTRAARCGCARPTRRWAPSIDAGLPHRRARPRRAGRRGGEGARRSPPPARSASVLADEWSPGATVHGRDALRASVPGHPRVAVPPGVVVPDGHRRAGRRGPELRVRGIEGCGSSTPR